MALALDPQGLDFDAASRTLLRRLAQTSGQMEAAEPGTDDFLVAYNESCRLREMYQRVRETWSVPPDVLTAIVADADLGAADLGAATAEFRAGSHD